MVKVSLHGIRNFSLCCGFRSFSRRIHHIRVAPLFCWYLKSFYCVDMTSKPTVTADSFKEKSDIYNGVSIDTRDLNFSNEEFEIKLTKALNSWQENGVRGVWFRVDISHSSFIPVLVKHSFVFHHAKETYVMLTRWLPENEPNLLPQFPHTHIGVGGMVINDDNEVLVIQERYAQKPHWKFPGGYSNPGEDFTDTARREILEETGIDSEFVSVVSLRHMHQHIFDCSDIYVVCLMRPLSSVIKSNKDEISQCQWMDVDTYVNHPSVTDFNRRVMQAFLKSRLLKVSILATPVRSFRKDCYHQLYAIDSIDKK